MNQINSGSFSPQEPCLVKAGQGFSVLYKDRFLYSKYSPDRAILQTVAGIDIQKESLILAISPCLWYGLDELLNKLPENCFIVGVEIEPELYKLAEKSLSDFLTTHPQHKNKVSLCYPENLESLIKPVYRFRRAVSIEMSAGTFFNSEQFKNISFFAQNYIGSWWKNRITLVKLGKLFCRNFIRNICHYPSANPIPLHSPVLNRPIVVFGAGESAESFITGFNHEDFSKMTIIAVDAALPVLLKHNLKPDFVVAVESQLAIEKAYIGALNSKPIMLCDLCGRPSILEKTSGHALYFFSQFDECSFFSQDDINTILPPKVPPLGSVGLTAVYLALLMRKDLSIPVFTAGLDFSYSRGFTHVRGAPAHTTRLNKTNRLFPVANFDAAFKNGASIVEGKNKPVITDITLNRYAELFQSYFTGTKNLYDAGQEGLFLNIPAVNTKDIKLLLNQLSKKDDNEYTVLLSAVSDKLSKQKLTDEWIHKEKNSLYRLIELLSKGDNAIPAPVPSLEEEIHSLLIHREYLYLHFADGYVCRSKDISFLKRVRNEIDFYLKDFDRTH